MIDLSTLAYAGLLLAVVIGLWIYKRFFGNGEFLYTLEADDPEMQAAVKKALRTLPEFWTRKNEHNSKQTDFSLKVWFQAPEDTIEHIWLEDIEINATGFTGRIGNQPQFILDMRLGQMVDFSEDQITDWMYTKDEKIYGNYTLRAHVKKMSLSKKELAEFEDTLGENS